MGYDSWMSAEFVVGGVKFTEVDTNPQWGGVADAGPRTFQQVLAGDVPAGFDAKELSALQARVLHVRDALNKLLAAMYMIGSANDAVDHGQSADEMYERAPVSAREAWALAGTELAVLLPSLADVVAAGTWESRWYQYATSIEAVLRTFP